MTERRVLTDEMWERLEPLLPDRTPRRGGQWTDHREVLEAIIWPDLGQVVRDRGQWISLTCGDVSG